MAATNKVLKEALTLKPVEKAELIDKLLSSLDKPDARINDLWAKKVVIFSLLESPRVMF